MADKSKLYSYNGEFNLADEQARKDIEVLKQEVNKSGNGLQLSDLQYNADDYKTYYTTPKDSSDIADSMLADITNMINSAVCSDSYIKTYKKIGEYYAHCPSVCIKNNIAYIVAFQNTESVVDSYLLEGTSTELYVWDITSMSLLAQYKVAGHGSIAGDLTFTYGSGAAQGVMIDENTIRIVFVAKLSNEKWYQCYRDFNIATSTFGDIGFCKIVSSGASYDFTTENVSSYIQEISDTTKNTNIVCQHAFVNGVYYVACGCSDEWANMPILKTTDWINFEYWVTPSVEGNNAKFEMAIATDGTYLYTATRQKTENVLCLMTVNLSDGSVAKSAMIPDGNRSRPFIIVKGTEIYVSHILTKERLSGSVLTRVQKNILQKIRTEVTLPPMVYPTFAQYGTEYFVVFMVPYALYCCKIPDFPMYSTGKAIGIMAKMINLVTGQ